MDKNKIKSYHMAYAWFASVLIFLNVSVFFYFPDSIVFWIVVFVDFLLCLLVSLWAADEIWMHWHEFFDLDDD